MTSQSLGRFSGLAMRSLRLGCVLLVSCFVPAPVRAQMTEDAFLNAVMPALTRVDFGNGQPMSATWLAPEFWTFHVTREKNTTLGEALIGQKLIAQALLFVVTPLTDRPVPHLKDVTARAVLRLPDGEALTPIRLPSAVDKAFAEDGKKGSSPVMVAFPARRPDGSPTLPPGTSKMRIEFAGRVFEWALPIAYPEEATHELERLAALHADRLQALEPPEGGMSEAMVPWLAEFGTIRGTWLAAAWCPPEWWELSWKSEKTADEGARAGFRMLFSDLTTFMLMSFEARDAKSLPQIAERCVLIDASGTRYPAVKLPAKWQAAFGSSVSRSMGKNGDVTAFLLAFKLKLDGTAAQPFRLVIEDGKGEPAATFVWEAPLALPPRLQEALAAGRRP